MSKWDTSRRSRTVVTSCDEFKVKKNHKEILFLTTTKIVIGDIDFRDKLGAIVINQDYALKAIDRVGKERNLCIHVFRTQNGLRFFIDTPHLDFDGELALLKDLHCDPIYVKCSNNMVDSQQGYPLKHV